jgi:hypothetical protein
MKRKSMLPENHASQSETLCNGVRRSSTSSLTLRETRVRKSASALRVMRPIAASMCNAASGFRWKSRSRSSRSSSISSDATSATAVAVRGPASRSAISPKKSPGPHVPSVIFCPTLSLMKSSTSPSRTR